MDSNNDDSQIESSDDDANVSRNTDVLIGGK